MEMMQKTQHIIFYDEQCGLCSRSVQFVRKRDRRGIFRFISRQSQEASGIFSVDFKLPDDSDTVIFFNNGRLYFRSEAAIRILMALGGFYKASAIFLLVPQIIRDYFYKLIAKNRHRWFKPDVSCEI